MSKGCSGTIRQTCLCTRWVLHIIQPAQGAARPLPALYHTGRAYGDQHDVPEELSRVLACRNCSYMRSPRPWSTRFVLPRPMHPGQLVELRQLLQCLAHLGNRLLAGRFRVHQDGCDLEQDDSTGNPQNALQAWGRASSGPEVAKSEGPSREVYFHCSCLSAVPSDHGIDRNLPICVSI